ncbi:MAG: hypothetical protein HZA49_01070 [Planctomycetes bacterium]|nr:hypothetical protein [Planctomycetota bacterium]
MKTNRKSILGTTFIEMMIAIVCLSAVAIATFEIMTQSQETNDTVNAWNMLTQWGQTAINKVNLDVTQACVLYQNDTLGNGYKADLQSEAGFPALATSTLPTIDETGTFSQDSVSDGTSTRTGNAILYATNTLPYISKDPADGGLVTPTRRVDMYRMVYYYLSPVTQTIGASATSLRLVKWTSREFADYNQVAAITATERTNFVIELYFDRGIRHLWVPRDTSDTAFYAIDEYGGISALPEPSFTIPTGIDADGNAMVKSVIDRLGRGFASLAWNNSTTFRTPDIVPKFAMGSQAGAGFPHGMEVQIIGPTGARQVLVRLVLAYVVSGAGQNLYSTEAHTIVTLREY